MRKMLLAALAATALVPTVGSAQTLREVRHDQREVRRDLARGDYREARKDRRETRDDWRDYRRTHRSYYHRPAYVAPRGYRYRRVGIGFTLNRVFWGSPYRVDYNYYRLPPPYPGTTYVRYGNDVLLISLRTGRVIAAYDDFFW